MKTLVILTGAGMSAESGISTFRDSGGLWEKFRIEDVATPEAWARNPALVQEFYNVRRRQLVHAKPNNGHVSLVELEKNFDVQIITQNVDNLHERAGSTNVLHLHGELMKMRSAGPGQEVFDVQPEKIEYTIHDKCPKGYPLRPHIVWFGEEVPEISNASKLVEKADILVIIGTSMQVYPAAGLLHYARPGIPLYLIDPNEVEISPGRAIMIRKGASEGVEILKKELLKKI
ncbi:MAG: NAD-dependent deacylase [Paludibacteraceae bacterium]|nr:NAD-dependent deacylase [Paludibacteraceae bacterium]